MNWPHFTERLVARLKRHEGFRSHVYKCPAGKWTIGYGRNVDPDGGGGITNDEAMSLLRHDIEDRLYRLEKRFPWFKDLDEVRQEVLTEMAFQLGFGGLQKFRRMLAAIEYGDYARASDQMFFKDPDAVPREPSAWHEQTPARCEELAGMMRTGEA